MVCWDQQPVEQIGSPFHGKMSETEDRPVLGFLLPTLGTGLLGTYVLPSGGRHSHRTSLSKDSSMLWKVEVSDGV